MKNNIVVIFSSHLSQDENQKFISHIDNTIGVRHKVICYTNFNQYGLSEIYNDAIKNHNIENCIFVMCHNDITIKIKNWGKILLSKFNNENFDIIGVAGTTYLSETGRWWEDRTKMLGIVEHTNGITSWVSKFSSEIFGVKEVVLIDGLFISFNPETIIHNFDETYKGFHFYDVSFCISNYLDGCNIGVTTSIPILHNSVGETNDEWENNRQQFVAQYKDELPITMFPQYYKINIKLTSEPKVCVIIPTKNNLKFLKDNITSWKNVVKYKNYEIIIADTGSDEDIIKEYNTLLCENIKLIRYHYYNYAKINNDVVKNHVSDDTELILFCNDDILLLNDALSRCVEIYNNNIDSVGTIGIRLHYDDASIQHNGIDIINNGKGILLTHRDIRKFDNYNTEINYNSFGNTGAFLLINKELFINIGCFNESYFECFEDVELNLECLLLNKKNITVSDAVAFHYESISRNKSKTMFERLDNDYFKNIIPFYQKNKTFIDNKIKSYRL